MKFIIVLTLYILGSIIYALWCIGDDKDIRNKIVDLEEKWLIKFGGSVILFRLIIISMTLVISMLWPVFIVKGIIYGIKESLKS
jgi:hypothetical protein